MNNFIFILKISIIPLVFFLFIIMKNLLYKTNRITVFVKRLSRKNIKNINIVIESLYFDLEKQQIYIKVYAKPFTLNVKPIYYKNLRFSTYEFAAYAQAFLLALTTAQNLLEHEKNLNITINEESLSKATLKLDMFLKKFSQNLEKKVSIN